MSDPIDPKTDFNQPHIIYRIDKSNVHKIADGIYGNRTFECLPAINLPMPSKWNRFKSWQRGLRHRIMVALFGDGRRYWPIVLLVVGLLASCIQQPAYAQDRPIHTSINRLNLALSISLATSAAIDVESTRSAISKGYLEQNPITRPFMNNRTSAYSFMAGGTGAVILGADWLDRSGHQRLGRLVKVSGIVVHLSCGLMNWRLK